LSKRRDLDAIFAALGKSNLVVVDCRAASTDLFIDFFNEIDLPAMLTAFDAKLTLVMPVNHESDSVDQVQRLADQFGKKCNYVVVRNAAHSDSFALFESSEVRAQLIQTLRIQFEREIHHSLERIQEAIAPYTRFVRAEREKMLEMEGRCKHLKLEIERLKGKLENI